MKNRLKSVSGKHSVSFFFIYWVILYPPKIQRKIPVFWFKTKLLKNHHTLVSFSWSIFQLISERFFFNLSQNWWKIDEKFKKKIDFVQLLFDAQLFLKLLINFFFLVINSTNTSTNLGFSFHTKEEETGKSYSSKYTPSHLSVKNFNLKS